MGKVKEAEVGANSIISQLDGVLSESRFETSEAERERENGGFSLMNTGPQWDFTKATEQQVVQ